MSNYLALNIGRNVPLPMNEPMHAEDWARFQAEALDALKGHAVTWQGDAATVVASGIAHQDGEWQGQAEESALVWIVTAESIDAFKVRDLWNAVRVLAIRYGQDAIAVIDGESTLVNA